VIRRFPVALALALALPVLAGASAVAGKTDARGDPLAALEDARARIVGEVEAVTPLEYGAHRARIRVERTLPEVDGATPPPHVDVVWEEPALSLPPRLGAGDRVLLALQPLPSASIWKQRIPDAADRARLLALVGRPPIVWHRPAAGELDILEHFLRLGPDARAGEAGLHHLLGLCASAQPDLAEPAARRIERTGALGSLPASEAPAALVVAALLRDAAPGVRDALLAALASARPAAVRVLVEARLSTADPRDVPVLSAALAAIDGGLDDGRALALLRAGSEEARLTAARWARGPKARAALRRHLVDDPSPAVRSAAVRRLVAIEGKGALEDATRALDDPEPDVRLAAVESIARLDPDAVATLVDITDRGRPDAARAAVAALSMMGDEAHLALAEIARDHADAALRELARVAIGLPIGERH